MLKTVHYRQVEWINQQEDVVDLLRQSLQARPHIENTVHSVNGEDCEVRRRSLHQSEIRLHLVTYVAGALKGVRETTAGQAAADVLEASPPPNSEFVEREIAVVVRTDRLGYVASGHTVGSTVEKSIRALLRLHHPASLANRLFLPARVDPAMLAQLIADGVDQLDLSVALPGPDAEIAGVGQPVGLAQSLGRSVWDGISSRIFEDHDDHDIDALAHATTHIGIRLGRKPSAAQIEALTVVAADAVASGDEFTIRNTAGTVFSRDKLTLKTTYAQEGAATTLAVNQAWQQISAFLNGID